MDPADLLPGVLPTGGRPSIPPQPGPPAALVGTLAETPLPQLLLMLLTRAYSGSLLLQADGETEIVLFARGAPTHVVPPRPLAPIGEMLVSLGVLRREELADALAACKASGARLGEEIARDGGIAPEVVDWVVRAQLLSRVRALMGLPRESTFEFHLGTNLLQECDVADEAVPCDPLEVVLTAMRYFREHDRMDEGLARLGDRPIRLHARARTDRFGLSETEQTVVDRIRAGPPVTYPALCAEGIAPQSTLRSLLYALVFTRHIDLGMADAWPAHVVRGPSMDIATVSDETRRGRRVVQLAVAAGSLTHYELLEIAPDASRVLIDTAAAGMTAQLDPAALPERLAALRPAAQRLVARIGRARETLSDSTRRAEYDAVIALPVDDSADAGTEQVEAALAAAESYRKAEALVRSGDMDGAERMAARAMGLDPDRAETVALLGWIRGTVATDPDAQAAALTLLGRAIELDPRSDRALVYRAMIHRRLGNEPAALRDFAKAVEINPANVDAARAARANRASALSRVATRNNAAVRVVDRPDGQEKGRSRAWIAMVAAAALLLVVLAVLAFGGRTPAVQTRDDLIAFGLEREVQAEGDAEATEHEALLQRRGTQAALLVAKLLADRHRVEDGSGSSADRPVQTVANEYLIRYAAFVHRDPPAIALEMANAPGGGRHLPESRWSAIEAAWMEWLAGK